MSAVSDLRDMGFSVHKYDDGSFLVDKPGVLFGIELPDEDAVILFYRGVRAGEALAAREPAVPRELQAARKLCEVYFSIAATEVGEDEVRRRRDEIISCPAVTDRETEG